MTDRDNITLPREVVEQLLKMLEMVEPYADQLTDYSSTAAEWPLNLLPKKVSEAITALRTHLTAEQPVAKAWAEGYQQGVKDERTSEASIGIAGFGAKVEPARQNPYGTALAAEPTKPIAVPKTEPLPPITCGFVDVRFDGEKWFCDKCGKRMSADFEASVRRGSGEKCYLELMQRKAEAVRTMNERNMK